MTGVREWLAQKKGSNPPITPDPVVTAEANAYAASGKPHWLATAFPPEPR
jgi:hypothetical protein